MSENQDQKDLSGLFCYSTDDENYQGSFNTFKEAVKAAVTAQGSMVGETIIIGKFEPYSPTVDVEKMLEEMLIEAGDEIGESVENWALNDVPKNSEQFQDLFISINNTFNVWLAKNKLTPNFYKVVDTVAFAIDEDMANGVSLPESADDTRAILELEPRVEPESEG